MISWNEFAHMSKRAQKENIAQREEYITIARRADPAKLPRLRELGGILHLQDDEVSHDLAACQEVAKREVKMLPQSEREVLVDELNKLKSRWVEVHGQREVAAKRFNAEWDQREANANAEMSGDPRIVEIERTLGDDDRNREAIGILKSDNPRLFGVELTGAFDEPDPGKKHHRFWCPSCRRRTSLQAGRFILYPDGTTNEYCPDSNCNGARFELAPT